jgi:hypothetical protein
MHGYDSYETYISFVSTDEWDESYPKPLSGYIDVARAPLDHAEDSYLDIDQRASRDQAPVQLMWRPACYCSAMLPSRLTFRLRGDEKVALSHPYARLWPRSERLLRFLLMLSM